VSYTILRCTPLRNIAGKKIEKNKILTVKSRNAAMWVKIGKLYKFKKVDVLKWIEKEKQNKVVDVDAYVSKYLQNNILKG
jgi:hypothetical protein